MMEQVWHVIPHFEALKKVDITKVTFFFLCAINVELSIDLSDSLGT